jgi:hypothetical protein
VQNCAISLQLQFISCVIQILCRKWASKSLVYICVHWNVKTLSLTPNTLFHTIEHFILNGQRTKFFSHRTFCQRVGVWLFGHRLFFRLFKHSLMRVCLMIGVMNMRVVEGTKLWNWPKLDTRPTSPPNTVENFL